MGDSDDDQYVPDAEHQALWVRASSIEEIG
jgi:hypothetical protein